MKIAGIYYIKNVVNSHTYIGQSVGIKRRLSDHKSSLIRGDHKNTHLQRAFLKYGKDKFEFGILVLCDISRLDVLEKEYILMYQNKGISYNIEGGGNKKKVVPLETRIKQSAWQIGKKLPIETRKKISASQKGKIVIISEATKKKISKSLMGKYYGKYGENHFGAKLTDADIENIRLDTRPQSVIAKEYGVDPSHISRIKRFGRRDGHGRNIRQAE